MQSNALTLPQDARKQRPYRSLYAAIMFQSFRDAVAEASSTDRSTSWVEAGVRVASQQVLDSSEGPSTMDCR